MFQNCTCTHLKVWEISENVVSNWPPPPSMDRVKTYDLLQGLLVVDMLQDLLVITSCKV